MSELCFLSAVELAAKIKSGEVSSREVVGAHLERIEQINPVLNAFVTMNADQAMDQAAAADETTARSKADGESLPLLHGLPVGVKDLDLTAGIRTTFGSPVFADFVPKQDELLVERYKTAGAIVLGKTNTPEFGAGSQTFNTVFGATRNPYDHSKTCGGSSGGSAVALASRMVPLASGGDLGGSLRNPGSYNNIAGFRPSPGRIPTWPATQGWWSLSVKGPMGRTVADTALQLTALAGPDNRAPLSNPESGFAFGKILTAEPLSVDLNTCPLAWSPDLGRYPVDPTVQQVLESSLHFFEDLGCNVDQVTPDFTGADEAFQTLRAWKMAHEHGDTLKNHRDKLKDTVIWNIEAGLNLTGADIARAEAQRTKLYERMIDLLTTYRFLLLPVSPVPPFSIDQPYPMEVNGTKMKTYIDWMAHCYAITLTGLPAISIPAGFTPDGLPVGLQIVGRPNADLETLQLAHAFETLNPLWKQLPKEVESSR